MAETVATVGHDELATLKVVALSGGLAGPTKLSCSGIAGRLDTSNQTASRRLQALERAGYVERDVVSDGQWVEITDAGEHALRGEYSDYRRIFEDDTGIRLVGAVTAGMGEGKHYITLSGYSRQFRDRLGYEPFPGTLNVELDDRSVRERAGLSSIEAVRIDEWEDDERTYGAARCYPARIENEAGAVYEGAHVIVPDRTHHDEHNLELIAPDRLRDELELADDDTIEIHVEEP